MCRYIVSSRELRTQAQALGCADYSTAVALVSTLKTVNDNVYFAEVTPVVLFLRDNDPSVTVAAYRPLPVGVPASDTKLVATPLGTRKAVQP